MNLYQLASQDEAWGAYAPDDDTTPWTAWPADPPAPMPSGPVPLDAALDAAAREYGVDADVLRALGPGASVDSIFDTAASLRSRLEAFGGDYAQALASYRQADEGHGSNIALAAPAAAPLSPPPLADARMPAPAPVPAPAPSERPTAAAPRPRPARPPASTPVPPPAARPDQPPAPPDGRLGAADDPRSLLYRPAPAAQKPVVDAARSQPGSGTDAASFAPVRPEVRQALGNAWDAASPGERQRMQSMPGWQGQLARERAAQYAQADKGVLAASPTAALLDGRAENRAKAPPATDAAPRAGGNGRAQSQTALRSTTPAGAAEPAPLPQRSWGEAISDATKSAAQGILDVASLPGVAYSAVTGDYDTAYLNAIRGTQEVLQDEKSPAFQAKAQALQQKLATAEGWREKLAVGGWETLKNPTLLGDTLARSAPGMLAGGLIGRAAGGAADAAGNALLGRTIATGSEAAARSAVALKNAAPAVASGTAVGAAAAQQGASVANDLYAELRKLPTSAFAAEPEFQQLARDHGPDKARDILAAAATTRALLVGTGASVLSMKLPGGDAIEKAFLPSHLKGGAAREAVKSSSFLTQPLTRGMQGNLGTQALETAVQVLKQGTTGSLSEGAEEASGAVAQGLELSRAGQDVKLSDMASEAAGQAMAAGFAMDGAAGTRRTNPAPRVQDQPTQPGTPPASPPPPAPTIAHGLTAPAAPTASGPAVPPPPFPAATLAAALLPGYPQALQPDSVPTWSNAASATRKAQAEAEILRQAEALPALEAATATATAPSPAAPSATPAGPLPASTDGNHSGTQQGADALSQRQVSSNAGQSGTTAAADPAANAPGAPAPTPSAANAEADASAAEAAPATTQHGTARHTAAAQVQPQATAPIDAQVQALDSGMLVVGGDQTTILAHLQAGGVRGAEPFAGVTLVPVDQAALAQQVLSRPLAAPAGPSGTQADRGAQRASATATLPRGRTAAQLAPTATQAPTAGSSIGGPNPVGARAPRTVHGSQTNAGASQPVPVMEMQRDGTLMIKGDPVQLQERLRQGGVERVLRREGGVLVGLDQVHKARQLLQQPPPRAQASAGATLPSQPSSPALSGQQFSRSPPDRPSRARGRPSKPATVQSVRAAVARLTNSMGLLAEGRGRVVVATSADIQAHWEPLVGKVDMGSQDTGLAKGFYDPNTNTVFLIADHIEAGQEMAVAVHELVHKHGKAVLGEARWRQLHEVIGSWANRPEGSLERRVHDEAAARVQASRPAGADETSYSSEELFPYAVQVAMELGVQPTALMPANSVHGWLARVRAAMRGAWDRLTNKPELFDSQDLVDLAFAVAQRENPAYASEFAEASAPVAPRPGITGQQMQGIVDKALDGLGMRGMVAPQIAQSPGVVGLVAPPGTVATGGVYRGELYLFLEGIRDEVEGFRVVFHELFHLGLSQSIQPEEYRQAMLQFLSDPLVRKYAARWRMTEDGQASKANMPINNWHAKAVEEAMADISEELHADQRGMGTREMADWVRRTIAWMADLAHQWGMPKVARRLRGMTLTQAEAFVVDTVLKARTGAPVLLPDARWATSREEGKNPNLTKQLDEASQEPPKPRLDVSDKFNIKRYDGMTDIDYLDAENGTHGLNAYINRDGILSLEIRAQGDASILGSGTDMFSSLMKRINSNNIFINGINGVWELGTDSVNAAEFVQNINTGMTREQAAMNTWTGRMASRYGYTAVLVPDQLGSVQFAYFRRPN